MEYPLPVIDSRQAEATGVYVAFEIGNAAFGFDLPLKQKIVGYIGSFNFYLRMNQGLRATIIVLTQLRATDAVPVTGYLSSRRSFGFLQHRVADQQLGLTRRQAKPCICWFSPAPLSQQALTVIGQRSSPSGIDQ